MSSKNKKKLNKIKTQTNQAKQVEQTNIEFENLSEPSEEKNKEKRLTKQEIREKILKDKEEKEKAEQLEKERMKPFEGGATFGKRFELSTILFAIVSSMFAILFFKVGMCDSDFLWHAKLGNYINETKSFPTTDIFSWIGIEKALPYTAHSWAFSMIAGSFSNNMGVYVAAYTISAIAAFFLFLFVKTTLFPRRNIASFFLAALIGYLCANPRPGVWGYVLFVYALLILQASLEKPKTKSWLTLPIISLIWVNLHGGTLIILLCIECLYFVLGIFPNFKIGFLENNTAVSGDFSLLKFKKKDGTSKSFKEYKDDFVLYNKNAFKTYWIKGFSFIALSILFALLNPYGLKTLIWGFTENSSATKMLIGEWQPIQLKEPLVLMVLFVLVIYILMFYKKGIKLHKVLPMICCLGASSIYQRFIVYAVLASFIPLSEIVKKLNKKGWITWRWNSIVFAISLVIVVSIGSFEGKGESNYILDKELDTYLSDANLERPYTEHNQGGKLIYAGYKTFIDQRFTDELMVDAMMLQSLQARPDKKVEDFIEEMNFDSFVLSKEESSPLILYLELQPNKWQVNFNNDEYIVFVKNNVIQNTN